MSYNHGIEEKRFKGRWEQQEKLFRQNGMTDEQIAALRKFDEECFKQDRAFYRRTTLVAEPERLSEGTAYEHSDTYIVEYWIELVDDEERYKKLIKVPQIMRKAFYMYKALGLFQNDISSKLSIPQQTISYWIVKIAEILK